MTNPNLSAEQHAELITVLKTRFDENLSRHKNIVWSDVRERLSAHPSKLWSLHEMEQTGGEPDVIGVDEKTGDYLFCDCSPESPLGRRNTCYDPQAQKARRTFKPPTTAVGLAEAMGIELLTETQYRKLQQFGHFDTKTSSWLKTPPAIRELGGALFADYRYGQVFIYHNGASSYYSSRGFRGLLSV